MVRGLLGWLAKVGGGDVHWALSWCGGRNVCGIGKCVIRNKVWKVSYTVQRPRWVSEQEMY